MRRIKGWITRRQDALLARELARRVASRKSGAQQNAPLLVISHDAHLAGAQRLLLDLLVEWRASRPFPVRVICVGPGILRDQFAQLFPTLFLADFNSARARRTALLDFIEQTPCAIYSNTVVNGSLLGPLRALGAPVITHCHELQTAIERWAPVSIMAQTLVNSDYLIAASNSIADNLRIRHQVPNDRVHVVYAFIDFWSVERAPTDAEIAEFRTELGVTDDDLIVFGCGTTDWRKGPDLFVAVAIAACRRDPKLKFIWIGGETSPPQFRDEIAASGLTNRIFFIGYRAQARRYFYAGHLFALTSREDPCALVALEAANANLPVICFDGAGDIPKVLGPDCGAVVPFEDSIAFSDAVVKLAASAAHRGRGGAVGCKKVRLHHSAQSAATAIEEAIAAVARSPGKALGRTSGSPLVSVVIPNYNHQSFLEKRLRSVTKQSLRDIEIIVLDDASTDDSRRLLESFAASEPRAKLLCNEVNSGSTFKQWRKGLSLAQGKYIWIAESDDWADRRFLEKAVAELERDVSIAVAHTHSIMVDIGDKSLGRPDAWLNDLAQGRWNADFNADGFDEIRDYLSQKNTIPNASAVVFRNFPGIESLVDDSMRLCADWLFWIRLLARGRYAFLAAELNYWRQNSSNARTRPPGVLEWEEGQRVLRDAAAILGLGETNRSKLIETFHARCVSWSGGNLDAVGSQSG